MSVSQSDSQSIIQSVSQ